MTAEGFLDLFVAKAQATPETVFALFDGEPIRFGGLARQVDSVATTLHERGLARGDRVAVMMRNSPAALATVLAIARAGAVWVPINAQLRGLGLGYILCHSEPALTIADAELVPTIRDSGAVDPARIVIHGASSGSDGLDDWLATGAGFAEALPTPGDCLAICYTSGTTGSPKGVLLSHAMLRFAGEAVALLTEPQPGDVFLVWEPLYHIGGAQMLVLPLIREVTLAMVNRFSASNFWHQALQYGASHIHYLGGVLQVLLKQPPSLQDRDHGVRIAWGGGCPSDIWESFRQRFGVEICEAYGMTEASSITTYNTTGVVGSVGKPVPWLQVELRGDEGQPVPPGQSGEIVVRTHCPEALFAGYFRDPEASARALRDGALWTGDLGRFDDAGNLYFLGRLGDSVRCRGENVSAREVERIAVAHPDIEDCAMIGVAAEIGEQDIKLFVQPRAGTTIRPAALSRWLGERLAPYQNPRYISMVEEFERTPSERIAKRNLPRDTAGCWDRLASC
ncbi:MAG: AMP-binding protein [Alphaproteobacteria bacterium]|nr:AMP-binding protein [Alphaproteobacteria bacterium]